MVGLLPGIFGVSGIELALGNSTRIRRNLIDTAIREFDAHSRDAFARRMFQFPD